MLPQIKALIEHPHYRLLCAKLAPAELRLVGGCVRDAVLGLASEDMDLATPLTPEEVTERLTQQGIVVKPTGLDYGTVTALVDRKPYEITTLRCDMECDGRHVTVRYSTDWREDASRRDFTFNALSLNPEGVITDYFGGVEDAKAGSVRFVGEPKARIQEDYLRILRFFRFYGRFGQGAVAPDILVACSDAAPRMAMLSGERIQKEMLKILAQPDPSSVLQTMQDCGVLPVVIPSLHSEAASWAARKMKREEAYAHYLEKDASSVALRRLAYLLYQPVLTLDPITERWKLSRSQQKTLQNYCTVADSLRTIARTSGIHEAWNVLLVQAKDTAEIERASAWLGTFSPPDFPLTGHAVMEARPELKGKKLGEWLKKAEMAWEESNYQLGREELLKLR